MSPNLKVCSFGLSKSSAMSNRQRGKDRQVRFGSEMAMIFVSCSDLDKSAYVSSSCCRATREDKLVQQADRCLTGTSMVSLVRHPEMLAQKVIMSCW